MTETNEQLEPVLAYEGNCSLKQDMGGEFKIATYITEEKLKSCETLLQKAVDEFFTDAEADLHALESMIKAITPETIAGGAHQIQTHAYNIKSLAKVLGFTLISEVCVHLVATTASQKLNAEKQKAILENLVNALRLTFMQRIRDDGGVIGQEILKSLRKHV